MVELIFSFVCSQGIKRLRRLSSKSLAVTSWEIRHKSMQRKRLKLGQEDTAGSTSLIEAQCWCTVPLAEANKLNHVPLLLVTWENLLEAV